MEALSIGNINTMIVLEGIGGGGSNNPEDIGLPGKPGKPFKLTLDRIGYVAHRAIEAYNISIGHPPMYYDDEQQKSMREGILFLSRNPNATPEDQHDKWVAYRRNHGWKSSDHKDSELRLHNMLVAWDDLPDKYKIPTILFQNIVKAMLPYWDGVK